MKVAMSRNSLPLKVKNELNNANVFYSSDYEQYVLSRSEKMYYFWDESFVLCLRVKKVLFVKAGVFDSEPFFLRSDGGFAKKENFFLDAVCQSLKKIGISWVLTSQSATFLSYPKGAVVVPRGNLICDLNLSVDELFSNVHPKHRNSIRRAERNGVEIISGGEIFVKPYSELEKETYERSSKKGAGYDYYLTISKKLASHSEIAIAFKHGKPQAGGVFFYNSAMGYYMHGASTDCPEPGSANLLIWNEMIKLKEMGVSRFNFVGFGFNVQEGSKYYGIQKFKERFGGVLVQCFNFRFVSNPLIYSLYCLCMKIKTGCIFKPYKDALDIQKHFYPELNKE